MPEPENPKKKQNWRFASLSSLRSPPRSFLCHPEPRITGSFVRGEALLASQFSFVGHSLSAPDSSIWQIKAPSEAYQNALHGFDWLNDLAATGDGLSRKLAQAWLLEWIVYFGQANGLGWHPALAGRRVVNWCSHGMFLLKGLGAKDSATVFKSLGRHVNFISNNWKATPQGLARFEALTGLVYAGLALEGCEFALRPALKGLADECQSRINPEGGIPSRNPEELANIFTLLTWVAKLLKATGHSENPQISEALERAAPGLRALRLGDGSLTRFHGGGRGGEGQLDQALADAQVRSPASTNSFMGYERLSAGRTLVLMDAAAPPGQAPAHMSTLGFEMSSGRVPMLVNCGPGARLDTAWAMAGGETAAHNALTLEGQSLASADVTVERAHDLESTWLSATHKGFSDSFGVVHERRLLVASNGRKFSGEDRLFPLVPPTAQAHPAAVISRLTRGHSYMLHFHLHPNVKAEKTEQNITLSLPNGERWVFQQEGGLICLEGSVFLDRTYIEPRATKQIVVAGRTIDYVGGIRWSFTKA